MTINLPISRLVNVDVILTAQAAQAQDLSTLLVLGSSNVIDVVERIRTYATLDEVAADFGTAAVEYLCAVLWFGQSPQPTQLKIGRWAKTATKAILNGGALSTANQAIAAWNAVTAPNFFIIIGGVPHSILPASLATATNLNGVASLIQTALAAASTGSTCVWDSNNSRFEIQSGSTGATSTLSYAAAPTSTGNIMFAANPLNNATITLNGTVVTFVSGTPSGNQVKIGADLATTLASLLAFLTASVDTQLVKFKYLIDATHLYLYAAVTGSGGDALTIAASLATPSGATLAGGTGTDISGMLAMLSSSSGSYIANGIGAETALAAATLFDSNYGQTWYALNIPEAVDADHIAVAGYIEGSNNKHLYGVSTQEAGVISSVSTTDIAYLLKQLLYKRTITQYSSNSAYSVCSLFGRALTVNYNGNSTVICLMFKQEPGIVAENLTISQVNALESKNCNVFVEYNNNTAIIEKGQVASGDFIDVITGTDWLAITIQTAIYNLLYTSATKIPQTDAGNHLIAVTMESVLIQAVANGLLAPGVWDANGFGQLSYGDFLPKGFYVYAPPIASQLQADREARKSVPFQIAAKLAGAVQSVNVALNVSR